MTENFTIIFGKYKGKPITRVPPGYLNWIINTFKPEDDIHKEAAKEIKRRGTIFPDIDISSHAIDKASLRCLKTYLNDRKENEGLHSWLQRVSKEAIDTGELIDIQPSKEISGTEFEEKIKNEEIEINDVLKIIHKNMEFVFEKRYVTPVLKTIIYKGGND